MSQPSLPPENITTSSLAIEKVQEAIHYENLQQWDSAFIAYKEAYELFSALEEASSDQGKQTLTAYMTRLRSKIADLSSKSSSLSPVEPQQHEDPNNNNNKISTTIPTHSLPSTVVLTTPPSVEEYNIDDIADVMSEDCDPSYLNDIKNGSNVKGITSSCVAVSSVTPYAIGSKEKEYLEILEGLGKAKKKKQLILDKEKEEDVKNNKAEFNCRGIQKGGNTPSISQQGSHENKIVSPNVPRDNNNNNNVPKKPLPPPTFTDFEGLTEGEVQTVSLINRHQDTIWAPPSYAPRTSQFVLHGIDISANLMKQGKHKIKQAIDVLQHIYYVGRLETNNSASFEPLLRDAIMDARRKYYAEYPPRLLQDNPVGVDEMELLRMSGRTTTIMIPIWDDVTNGYASENVYFPNASITDKEESARAGWIDPFSPEMSPKQKEAGSTWARAPQILGNDGSTVPPATNTTESSSEVLPATQPANIGLITSCDPLCIKQTIVRDCSLVCSLIVCASYQQRFPETNIISKVIFPQEAPSPNEAAWPILSQAGKYCVKMLINGITRLVAVDDRLPVRVDSEPSSTSSPNGKGSSKRLLCSFSTDSREMWVSILEKAFVKACGGTYDFPGSNSSTDLYMLSGWLPDSLVLKHKDFDSDFQWKRLYHSHKRGAMMATLSTPLDMDPVIAKSLKLVPRHAYALLDIRETCPSNGQPGHRLVKIKNPWSSSHSWEGLFSSRDKRLTPELRAEIGYRDEEEEQGVFWMQWVDVIKFFTRISISWNPYSLFSIGKTFTRPTRIVRHTLFQYSDTISLKPQFHVVARNGLGRTTRLHFVLSRHILDLSEYNIRPKESSDDNEDDDEANRKDDPNNFVPFLRLNIYETTDYPTVSQTVKYIEKKCSFPPRITNGRPSPHHNDKETIIKTPLGTIIEYQPLSSSKGVSISSNQSDMITSASGRRIHSHLDMPFYDSDAKSAYEKAYIDKQQSSNQGGTPETVWKRRGVLIHDGVYKNNVHQTISINCPPVYKSGFDGCRHFTCVVSQLLPTVPKENKNSLTGKGPLSEGNKDNKGVPNKGYMANREVSKFATLRSFPITLTLHSELPIIHPSVAKALCGAPIDIKGDTSPSSLPAHKSFINMTNLPNTILPYVTRVKSGWLRGVNCGGTHSHNTFSFNPQFRLSIPPLSSVPPTERMKEVHGENRDINNNDYNTPLTHLIARIIAPSASDSVQLHVVSLYPEYFKFLPDPGTDDGDGNLCNGSEGVVPWYGRVGDLTSEEGKFILAAPMYSDCSATVDTTLASCLQMDVTNLLARVPAEDPIPDPPPPLPPMPSPPSLSASGVSPAPVLSSPFLLPIVLYTATDEDSTSANTRHNMSFYSFVGPNQHASLLLLPLLSDGIFVSPTVSFIDMSDKESPTAGLRLSFSEPLSTYKGLLKATSPEVLEVLPTIPTGTDPTLSTSLVEWATSENSLYYLRTNCPAKEAILEQLCPRLIVRPNTAHLPFTSTTQELQREIFTLAGRVQRLMCLWHNINTLRVVTCPSAVPRDCTPDNQDLNNKQVSYSRYISDLHLRRKQIGTSVYFATTSSTISSPYISQTSLDIPIDTLLQERKKEVSIINESLTNILIKIDALDIDDQNIISGNSSNSTVSLRDTRRALVGMINVIEGGLNELISSIEGRVFTSSAEFDNTIMKGPPTSVTKQLPTSVPSDGGSTSSSSIAYVPVEPPLHRLPPGEYILIASQYSKGPAPFEIVVETECPHLITEIPLEGCTRDSGADPIPNEEKNSNNNNKHVVGKIGGSEVVPGYLKWPSACTVSGNFLLASPSVERMRLPIPLDPLINLGIRGQLLLSSHPIFTHFPSLSIFVPGFSSEGLASSSQYNNKDTPLIISVRLMVSAPDDTAVKSKPSVLTAKAQLLLFLDKPDGTAVFIASSGRDARSVDVSLTAVAVSPRELSGSMGPCQPSLATQQPYLVERGSPNGSLHFTQISSDVFQRGRRYRLVLAIMPSYAYTTTLEDSNGSITTSDGQGTHVSLPYFTRCYASIGGVTVELRR